MVFECSVLLCFQGSVCCVDVVCVPLLCVCMCLGPNWSLGI